MKPSDAPWRHWCRDCGMNPVKAAATSCTRCEREATNAARALAKSAPLCEACGEAEVGPQEFYCDPCEDAMIASLGDREEGDHFVPDPKERCERCGFHTGDVVFGVCGDCYAFAKRTTAQRPQSRYAPPPPPPIPPYRDEHQTFAARRQRVTA